MEYVKEIIRDLSSEELKENVKVCLEHSSLIFSGNYEGLYEKGGDYIKDKLNLEGEINNSDLEFKAIFDVFQMTMKSTQSLLHSVVPVKSVNKLSPLAFVILGVIQAFELSEVPSIMPPIMEALVTGRWKNFVLNAAGLMSPSGMKLEVIHQIIMYLIKEDFGEWCKREVIQSQCQPGHEAT